MASRASTIISGASIGILLVSSWYLCLQNRRLQVRIAELDAAKVRPYLTTGLLVDLSSGMELVAKMEGPSRPIEQRLLLLSSDRCTVSENNIPNWEALVREIRPDDATQVIFATYDTYHLASRLEAVARASGTPCRIYKISRPEYFGIRTGLVGTPTTLLLTTDNRPLLIHAGKLESSHVQAFKEALHNHYDPTLSPSLFSRSTVYTMAPETTPSK